MEQLAYSVISKLEENGMMCFIKDVDGEMHLFDAYPNIMFSLKKEKNYKRTDDMKL